MAWASLVNRNEIAAFGRRGPETRIVFGLLTVEAIKRWFMVGPAFFLALSNTLIPGEPEYFISFKR